MQLSDLELNELIESEVPLDDSLWSRGYFLDQINKSWHEKKKRSRNGFWEWQNFSCYFKFDVKSEFVILDDLVSTHLGKGIYSRFIEDLKDFVDRQNRNKVRCINNERLAEWKGRNGWAIHPNKSYRETATWSMHSGYLKGTRTVR